MLNHKIITVTLALLLMSTGVALALELNPVLPETFIVSPYSIFHQQEANALSGSPIFRVAFRYDQPGVEPAAVRWLLKPAVLPNGQYCMTRNAFENSADFIVSLDESGWEDWTPWNGDDEHSFSFTDLPQNDENQERIYYICAVQVMAADGSVSDSLEYGHSVANFYVSASLAPQLSVQHRLLGVWRGSGPYMTATLDLLPGIDHGFDFEAEAEAYGSEIASYRWGWDLLDPDDENDPNWSGPAGLGEEQRHAPPITFTSGIHVLSVHVLDVAGAETRFRLILTMVPIPDPQHQLPLLLVDDVRDQNSNGWPAYDGSPLDRDAYRDSFWDEVLAGPGGVAGYDSQAHTIDAEDQQVDVRDVVNYRTVLWTGRWAATPNSAISRMRPAGGTQSQGDQLRYVWLGAYQENGGSLLYASSQAALNFLAESPYVLPVIFESTEGNPVTGYEYLPAGVDGRVGFGNDDLGPVHPRLYPYRNLGLAAVDVTSPTAAYYTPEGYLVNQKRRAACVGMKGLVLDADFVDNHMSGAAAFADTIWTDAGIDWNDDHAPADQDALQHFYTWGRDEFYDVDVMGRDVPVVPQDCDGEACVEPLWRSVSRFEWVQSERLADDPGDTWPVGYYGDDGQPDLDDLCGYEALIQDRSASRTNDQVTAFVTRKYLENKPGGVGDVVLGFDPYRFDHQSMREAVHWILGQHFGTTMTATAP